jgi:hypothetical protein
MSLFNNVELIEEDVLAKILSEYNENTGLELLPEDSNVRADRLLYVIDKIQNEQKELETQKQNSIDFYDDAIAKKKQHIDHLETNLRLFMDHMDKKTIKLPNGTLRMRTTKKFLYPEDKSVLLEFCQTRNIDLIVSHKPDLKSLKKYITITGDIPEGLVIEDVNNFSFKSTGGE